MPEKVTPEKVVEFSVDYICSLFESCTDERGVLHTTLSSDGIQELIRRFSFSNPFEGTYPAQRLFLPAFWVFAERYGVLVSVQREGDPRKSDYFWRLRNGKPQRQEFARAVLDECSEKSTYRTYLEANLAQCIVDNY